MATDLQLSSSIKLCVSIMLAIFAFSMANPGLSKETTITVYLQDIVPGAPNATGIVVAGPTNLTFGSVVVVEDRLTEKVSNSSRLVGLVQGIYIFTSKDGLSVYVSITVTFTSGKYNGSTLEIQGRSLQNEKIREYAIVGGTRQLRCAKGYVTVEPLFVDQVTLYSVGKCILRFRYGCF